MKKYGFFGGTFDPVHLGHLIVAQAVMEKASLDTLAFIPSANPPHKQNQTTFSAEERYSMLKAAVQDDPRFVVSKREMRRTGPSYTIDTIRELHAEMPDTEICFIMGYDNIHEINNWHEPEAILDESTVIAVSRPAYSNEKQTIPRWLEGRITVINTPLIDISSTMIRRRLNDGLPVRYLTPLSVVALMKKYHKNIQ